MAHVLIRDLSDETVARLKAKAKANGVTLQAILKESVKKAAQLTPAERLAGLDKVRIVPKFTEAPGQTLRDIAAGRAGRPGMEDWLQ
jgi:plasmid stability protein